MASEREENDALAMLASIQAWREEKLVVAEQRDTALLGFEKTIEKKVIDSYGIIRAQYNLKSETTEDLMPCII